MKKILSTLVCGLLLATTASADFARVEMGVGTWIQAPSGEINYSDTGVSFSDISKENTQAEAYAWLLVKHPVPLLPNLRLEYVTTLNEGEYVVQSGTPIGGLATGTLSELEMTQIDVIPYYNILDNTAWITLDLGLDIKIIDVAYSAGGVNIIDELNVDIVSIALPLGYVRARTQLPITNLGIEADVKYFSYDTTTVYDVRAKVDYTFDIFPVIQPGIEIGYRMQKIELEENGLAVNIDYSGVYAGLMVRF